MTIRHLIVAGAAFLALSVAACQPKPQPAPQAQDQQSEQTTQTTQTTQEAQQQSDPPVPHEDTQLVQLGQAGNCNLYRFTDSKGNNIYTYDGQNCPPLAVH